jgi:hypothetical protein
LSERRVVLSLREKKKEIGMREFSRGQTARTRIFPKLARKSEKMKSISQRT